MSTKTQLEDNTDSEICVLGDPVITEEMIEEECKLEKEAAEAEACIKEEEDSETKEKRLECFKKLMKHSEAYTSYISHKMHTQVNLRKFERARKFSLMRSYREIYRKKGIDCDKYFVDNEVKEEDAVDPQSILEGNMLNIITVKGALAAISCTSGKSLDNTGCKRFYEFYAFPSRNQIYVLRRSYIALYIKIHDVFTAKY